MKNVVSLPIGPGGTPVKAIELEFETEKESFNSYVCEDAGIRAKVKVVVQKIYALVDEKGRIKKDATGAPLIVTNSTNVQTSQWLGKKERNIDIPEDP